jgi:hypothetical protein
MNMAAPSVFSPPLTRPVPKRTIQAVAKHIAEKSQPEEIFLFGSYAYGKPEPSSDVDLLGPFAWVAWFGLPASCFPILDHAPLNPIFMYNCFIVA